VPVTVTVCVGSSCHIRGSRAVLKRFAEIIKTEGLDSQVALAGSFCMERCGEHINWMFGDEEISSVSVEQAEQTFRDKLKEVMQPTGTDDVEHEARGPRP